MYGGWGHIIDANKRLRNERNSKSDKFKRIKDRRENLLQKRNHQVTQHNKKVDQQTLLKIRQQIQAESQKELVKRYIKIGIVVIILTGISFIFAHITI